MSEFRRLFVPGGTYYFAARLADTDSGQLVAEIDLLRDCFRLAMRRWPFAIRAACVLPAELHMIWTLPPGDAGYPARWRLIKSTFSRHLPPPAVPPSRSKLRKGEKGTWQRRYWEHLIRDAADFDRHAAHVLSAPVRAGLVARPEDWAHSSLHRRPPAAGAPTLPRAGGSRPTSRQPGTASARTEVGSVVRAAPGPGSSMPVPTGG